MYLENKKKLDRRSDKWKVTYNATAVMVMRSMRGAECSEHCEGGCEMLEGVGLSAAACHLE